MKKIWGGVAAAADHEALRQIDAWLDSGQYLQVHARLDALRHGGSIDAGIRTVRAIRQLGAEREGDALCLHLGRIAPDHAEARIGLLRTRLYNRGPAAYYATSERLPLQATANASERAQYLSLRGVWLSDLRDMSEARKLHEQALALDGSDPWLWMEWSYSLTRQDRHADALQAAEHALQLSPGYRSGIQQKARLLVLLQRRPEALALLAQALPQTECAAIALQLEELLADEHRDEEALQLLAQAERLLPLADRQVKSRLAARRTDRLMALGRWAEAREQAALVAGQGFYSRMAERLAEPPAGQQRCLLPLEFVRQHWSTCAPATLTSLSRFWGRQAEHLEIAQAICYDGTPDVSERLWALGAGWLVREFRLDWPTACKLLDAGVPFALATMHAGGGHLQAVVGYDRLRGTLLIRDPSQPLHAEYEASALLDGKGADGPRAMLMMPPEEVGRLEGIELPEADAWDLLHALQAALERHERSAAQAVLAQMRQQYAGSRLAWRAERALALYDGNEVAILAATEALLALHPGDVNLQLSKAFSLGQVLGQRAAEEYLLALTAGEMPEPLVLIRLAAAYVDDGRRLPEALGLVWRALRRAPAQGRLWTQWAILVWQQGRRDAALPLYRWASTLQPVDEDSAIAFARACRIQGRIEEGLNLLRARVDEWGDRSGSPALSLADQLSLLGRQGEADAVLEAALLRRPEDAELKVQVAEAYLRLQRHGAARALLETAVQPSKRAGLERAHALLAEAEERFEDALAHAREAVSLEPLRLPHHRLVMRLLARREGRAAAQAWLGEQAAQFPAHYGLQGLLYEWLDDDAVVINAQLARIEQAHPDDPWLRREMAIQACRQGRHDDAVQLAQQACALATGRVESHSTLAYVLLAREGYAVALPHLQQALRLDVDHDYSLRTLINAAPDPQQARAAADFAAAELLRQVTIGDGLLNFQAVAGKAMPADKLEALLQRAWTERPELWQSWIALGRQLIEMGLAEAAHELLAQAAERFNALPRLQLELAEALRQLDRRDQALEASARALELSPGWNQAVRLHVDLLIEHGNRGAEAEQVLRQALVREPNDDDLIGLLAWLLKREGRADDALEQARRSLLLDPRAEWVWRLARSICEQGERLADFDALLGQVQQSRPGDAWAWTVQAQQHRDDATALAAAEQALQLEPRLEAAWLARFERLARLSRHDEIATLLVQLPWPAQAPVGLRAWSARLDWRRGEAERAIARRRELLTEAPHDFELWRELADWLDERDDGPGYLEAARRMRELAPHRPVPHAYVGHALSKLKRPAEAIVPLQRALQIDPTYGFAARCLGQAAREAGQLDAADEALQSLWAVEATPRVARQGIDVACAAGQREAGQSWLERLCTCKDYDTEQSSAALAALRKAGWEDLLAPLQQAQLAQGGGPAGICLEWLQDQQSRWTVLGALYQLHRRMVLGTGNSLAMAGLHWVGEQIPMAASWFVRRHATRLRGNDQPWGEVSYVLMCRERYVEVLRWTDDWRSRPRAPIWALSNRCASAYMLGGLQEIEALLQAALPRAPYNEDLRLWQLVVAARAGRLDELGEGLRRCHEWTADNWMKPVIKALHSFAEIARAPDTEDALASFRALSSGMDQALSRRIYVDLRRQLLTQYLTVSPWMRWLAEQT